jgi:hypothetical protein
VSLVQSVATHYLLNDGDYVELVVIQDSGGDLNVVPGTAFDFGMVKVP